MKDEDIDPGFLESRNIDLLGQYLKRGRKFERLNIEQLRNEWVSAFQKLCLNPINPENNELHDDLSAEFDIRNVVPPFDLIADEIEIFVTETDRIMNEIARKNPVRRAGIEAKLQSDLERFRQSKDRRN